MIWDDVDFLASRVGYYWCGADESRKYPGQLRFDDWPRCDIFSIKGIDKSAATFAVIRIFSVSRETSKMSHF